MKAENATDPEAAAILRLFTEISIIHQLSTTAARSTLAPMRLNPSEFALLSHFANRGDGQTPSDLARIMQMAKPSMSAMLAKLAAKGLVILSADAEDARRQRVHVTPEGSEIFHTAATALAQKVSQATLGLDRAALAQLTPGLATLRAHLDALRD